MSRYKASSHQTTPWIPPPPRGEVEAPQRFSARRFGWGAGLHVIGTRTRLIVVALLCAGFAYSLHAQPARTHAVPKLGFSEFGWFPLADDFQPPLSGPGPVLSDAAHPYFSNQTGQQPTFRIADLSNPILQPWARDSLRKTNEETRAGKPPFSPRETCWLPGVPGSDVFSRLRPVYFLQTPKQVTII